MKTRLERELQRAANGTPWDGILALLWKTAREKQNSLPNRLRVLLALLILPKGKSHVEKK
jgi:hypothetical protein